MRFRDLLAAFDDALDWAIEDPFLGYHLPSHLELNDPLRVTADGLDASEAEDGVDLHLA